ncbi:unnamed protein product [Amoebophrya sp. A25]|nr:unnamed protein product [Amoebophrya sp. A25]|eukprot:GSA25T00004125001.1
MSLKQVATSAALLGNGASAFLLTQQSSTTEPEKVACIQYYAVIEKAAPSAGRRIKKINDDNKAIELRNKNAEPNNKEKKKDIPESMKEMSKLVDKDMFSYAKEFALTCQKAGKTLKSHIGTDRILEDTEEYSNELQHLVGWFASTSATETKDLKEPKVTPRGGKPTEPTLGDQKFDYFKAIANLVDSHSTFSVKMGLRALERRFPDNSISWKDSVDAMHKSFVANCCAEPTEDDPAEQMNKLNMGAVERGQAEEDAATAAGKAQKEEEKAAAEKAAAQAEEEKAAAEKKAKEEAEGCCR